MCKISCAAPAISWSDVLCKAILCTACHPPPPSHEVTRCATYRFEPWYHNHHLGVGTFRLSLSNPFGSLFFSCCAALATATISIALFYVPLARGLVLLQLATDDFPRRSAVAWLFSSVWFRLHRVHYTPQSVEAWTLNVLLQGDSDAGLTRYDPCFGIFFFTV